RSLSDKTYTTFLHSVSERNTCCSLSIDQTVQDRHLRPNSMNNRVTRKGSRYRHLSIVRPNYKFTVVAILYEDRIRESMSAINSQLNDGTLSHIDTTIVING